MREADFFACQPAFKNKKTASLIRETAFYHARVAQVFVS